LNKLLDALPREERARIEPALQPVELDAHAILFDVGTMIDRLYFVDAGIVSVVAVFEDGKTAEVTAVGREGFVNVGSLLDDDLAIARYVMQIPGRARIMGAETARRLAAELPGFGGLMRRYTQAFIAHLSQSVACNSVHSVRQRMARWLLLVQDRTDGNELALTQEYLAEMLGVRRPSVNQLATDFRDEGLIDYVRGRVRVLDRVGLERVSCRCHAIVEGQYRRLLPELYDPEPVS